MISTETTATADLATVPVPESTAPQVNDPIRTANLQRLWYMVAPLTALFVWSYAPVFVELVTLWSNEPDYSHGFFVPILAAAFLWTRRGDRPAELAGPEWAGLLLIAMSTLLRIGGSYLYVAALAGWSIPLWIAGAVLFCGGWSWLRWSWPAVAFLGFMAPLPWRVETMLSEPLQGVAAEGSAWLLQCLGEPALAEGNLIMLGDLRLEVERACNGLRMFFAIAALAWAYAMLCGRTWWMNGMLMLAVTPVALLANILRITATGMVLSRIDDSALRLVAHDATGWLTAPFASVLMAGVLWYLNRLFVPIEPVNVNELVVQRKPRPAQVLNRPAVS